MNMNTPLRAKRSPILTPADTSAERVVCELEEDIILGRLRPRERLIEQDLARRFAVNRHIIRKALTVLENYGIVHKEPNKGAIVRDFSLDDVENVYEMRALLHERAAARISLPGAPELVATLEEIQARHSAAVEEGDLRLVNRINNEFHDTLFGACGNPYLAQDIAHYAWLAHAIRSYRIGDPDLLAQARDEHWRIIAALKDGDRPALVRLCVDHIQPSKEAYLLAHGWGPQLKAS